MKKNLTVLVLGVAMVCMLSACGDKKEDKATTGTTTEASTENVSTASSESEKETTESKTDEETTEQSNDTENNGGTSSSGTKESNGEFSFADIEGLEFWFSSGAGGWGTNLKVNADGSFSGAYQDSDMGDTGDGYPNGTVYKCDFSGSFSEPVKVNDYTWSVTVSNIEYEKNVGTEEIIDGTKYCYSEPYGLDNAENILIYVKGAPLSELPEDYLSWVGYSDIYSSSDTTLPFYGIYNEAQREGFSSYSN